MILIVDLNVDLRVAIEIFARGFAQVRSRTYPYTPTLNNQNIWILHDQPHRPKARAAELITSNPNPQHHIATGERLECARYFSSLLLTPENEAESLANFKAHGFKRFRSEPFYTLEPTKAILTPSPLVKRIQTPEYAELVRIANNGKAQIKPEFLNMDNAQVRLYAAIENDRAIGWVSAYTIENLGSWVNNLAVIPDRRNQGLGAALMSALLADDGRLQIPLNVLASSHLGSHLYPKLGFTQIATIHLLRPPNYPRKQCL